jgi:hypothetical protein
MGKIAVQIAFQSEDLMGMHNSGDTGIDVI